MEILEENSRIYMRELVLEDWEDLHVYASNKEACKYQPWGPNTEADSRFFVTQAIRDRNIKFRSRFVFVIVDKQMEQIVGNIELNIKDWDGVGELGFIIHHEHWGKGYGTEALQLMLDYCFFQQNLHRVSAHCLPENVASCRVLEKVGMVKEGVLRQEILLNGTWRDSVVYSVLKDEWVE
ncbi:GNAT family N-acetyltransferase [Halobacillus yeomjeoni]|nr:GNAT family N-acetyltransferase [Halobacillus yeomjeoni]